MKISERFEEEICSKCDDRTFCKRDMLQLHACATVETWNLLMKKGDESLIYECPRCYKRISEKEYTENMKNPDKIGFCCQQCYKEGFSIELMKKGDIND